MLVAIRHRGIVDGTWVHHDVGLGARRLPIIDVPHSAQPLFNEDRSLVLVGNGEIFNFQDLRHKLVDRGHAFRTQGDLECVLHLYEEGGDDFWSELRGQFAIALYDVKQRRLVLARDHIGIKPLYYYQADGLFLFGSEIKALLSHPAFRRRLNPTALADFLCLQYVPKPQTVYANLRGLPPGSLLVLQDGDVAIKPFWSIRIDSASSTDGRKDDANGTREHLQRSVARTLISDVPVGVLLSGGLDSSGIAAIAARQTGRPLHTFSIVFKEDSFDESPYSRAMARHLGSDHHEVVLDEDVIFDSLPRIADMFDEPFCEGSAYPLYHICRYAKDHVTVILSGEGADEIFGGYEPYVGQQFLKLYRRTPAPLRALFRAAVHRLPVSDNWISWDLKLRRFVDGALFSPPKAHFWWRVNMNDAEKRRVLNPDFLGRLERPDTSPLYEERFASWDSEDVVNRILAADCTLHLVDDLLLRADLMSMAHTMELRVPYLDVDFVDYAFRIPSRRKLRGFTNKIPLRDALKGIVPDDIRTRVKHGLNMPYQKWFKRPKWKSLLHDCLQAEHVRSFGLFDCDGVQAMLAEHERGTHNHAHALWCILNLILWLEKNPV
jgi:asparagine synthase (glutamine-hydrolysing)